MNNNVKSCENCKYSARYKDNFGNCWYVCMGQKNMPRVKENDCCPSWASPTALDSYERGWWDMFELITSAWYGKQCYFLEDDESIVYSRNSGRYLSRAAAIDEFLNQIGDGDI